MADGRASLAWTLRKWRAFCAARKAAAEQNPGGILRLAREVRALAEAARRVCPPDHELQSRISALHAEMRRISALAENPGFRSLTTEKRQMLRRGLVESREQLLRVLGAEVPTDRLQ